MFDTDATRGQCFVFLFLFGRERMVLAFLVRCLAVGVQFVHALIAAISQKFEVRRNGQATAFEQRKIMRFAGAGCHAQNHLFAVVNHDLSFLGMAFFLAGVAVALFF